MKRNPILRSKDIRCWESPQTMTFQSNMVSSSVATNPLHDGSRIMLNEHHIEHESSATPFDEWDLNQYDSDLDPIQWGGDFSSNSRNDEHFSVTPSPSNDTEHRFAGQSNVYRAPPSSVSKSVQFRDARCLVSQTPIHLRAIQRNLLATLSRNTQTMAAAAADQSLVIDSKEKAPSFLQRARTIAGKTGDKKVAAPKLKFKPTKRFWPIPSNNEGMGGQWSSSHLEGHTKDHRTIFSTSSFESTTGEGVQIEVSPSPYKTDKWYDFDCSPQEEQQISPLPFTTTPQDFFDCGTLDSDCDQSVFCFNGGSGGSPSNTFPHISGDFGPDNGNTSHHCGVRRHPPTFLPRPSKSKKRRSKAQKSAHTASRACIKYRYFLTTETMAKSFLSRHFNTNTETTMEQLASLPTPPGLEVDAL